MVEDVTKMSDAELVQAAGEGIGGPALRDLANAELARRLMASLVESSGRIEFLTKVLVVLTAVIVVLTVALLIRA
jgi:hypothetical protein